MVHLLVEWLYRMRPATSYSDPTFDKGHVGLVVGSGVHSVDAQVLVSLSDGCIEAIRLFA